MPTASNAGSRAWNRVRALCAYASPARGNRSQMLMRRKPPPRAAVCFCAPIGGQVLFGSLVSPARRHSRVFLRQPYVQAGPDKITAPMRVGLFVTCLVDLVRPRIGLSTLKLLEGAGCEVVVPTTQTCCGQ